MRLLTKYIFETMCFCLLVLCMLTPMPAANASTAIQVQGIETSYYDIVNVWSPNMASGISEIEVGYSWDHYVHIEALPTNNHVWILESYTCVNLGPCSDFISQTGTNDNAGHLGQPHVSIHHNITLTFHPGGIGNTVVDEHYEHGGIPWIAIHFKNGQELYVDTVKPGYPLASNSAPHVLEFYIIKGFGPDHAVFAHDGLVT